MDAIYAIPKPDSKMIESQRLMSEEYELLVKLFAENDVPLGIPNKHIEHAAILTKYIFEKAKNNVYIFSGGLPEIFIDKIKPSLIAALKRDVKIKIVVTYPSDDFKSCDDLMDDPNFELYEIKEELKDIFEKNINHFSVSDSLMFRFEDIHEKKDFKENFEVTATANFNHPEYANGLEKKFKDFLEVSTKINSGIKTV
jgi:sugar-specific transcriptional regulator TrmB